MIDLSLDEARESRPEAGGIGAARKVNGGDLSTSLRDGAGLLAELDLLAQSLRGYLVVRVEVDDAGHRRTYVYRNAGAAERCVNRARDRGRRAHVTLVKMLPVGVVVGLGDPRD